MNLLHLHYFYMVAKEGGYTKASRALYIQQSAISRMVGQLEDTIGFPLFERIGRRVHLTVRGREVFEHSKKIFAEVNTLKNTIEALKEIPKGPLHVGGTEPISSHLFPKVCETLISEYPLLHPHILSAPSSVLLEKIKEGELAFGVFFYVPELPRGLLLTELKKIRFYAVIKKEFASTSSRLSSFIGSREIDERNTKRFPTLDKLRQLYPNIKIRISSNNITAHRELVLRGLGVAVLPDFLILDDLKEGSVIDVLPKEPLYFGLKLVKRDTTVSSLNMKIFLSTLNKEISDKA